MKRTIFTITLWLFAMIFAKAQYMSPEVISSSGGDFHGTGSSLSWTLGEPVTETSTGSNAILTQGFQQDNYTVVSVFENPSADISVSVYPNPVTDIINISAKNSGETLNITLSDITGKLLLDKKTNESKTQLNMKQYPVSNYVLIIKDNRGEIIRTFKIVKSDNY